MPTTETRKKVKP